LKQDKFQKGDPRPSIRYPQEETPAAPSSTAHKTFSPLQYTVLGIY